MCARGSNRPCLYRPPYPPRVLADATRAPGLRISIGPRPLAEVVAASFSQWAVEADGLTVVIESTNICRVEFSRVEDARRVVFRLLDGLLSERQRARVASCIAAELRDVGLLGSSVEEHYSAEGLAQRIERSAGYVSKEIAKLRLAPVLRDARGYLIPASSANAWLARYVFESSTAMEKGAAAIGG